MIRSGCGKARGSEDFVVWKGDDCASVMRFKEQFQAIHVEGLGRSFNDFIESTKEARPRLGL